MTQIKIEVPANDHIALSAMADALQRIATERAPSVTTGDTAWKQMDKIYAEHNENTPKRDDYIEPVGPEILKNFKVYTPNTEKLNEQPESSGHVELTRTGDEVEASIHHNESFDETVSTLPDYETSIANFHTGPRVRDAATEQDDTLDDEGIPHDKRIHSKGATRLSDNTWRLRKRPADKTEEEWTAYIDSVKAELKAVQDIPNETTVTDVNDVEYRKAQGVIAPNCEVEVTLDEQAVADLTPPVIDEPATQLEGVTPNCDVAIEPPVTAGTPVAPVTPPTSLTPPVVEADKPSVTTFQELMLYMTSDAKKRGADNDMIKATLLEVDPALTAIPLIATRADLIPKFVTALAAKLA